MKYLPKKPPVMGIPASESSATAKVKATSGLRLTSPLKASSESSPLLVLRMAVSTAKAGMAARALFVLNM